MSDLRFTHRDNDGDVLEVRAGMLGAIIGAQSENEAEVAVRYEYLPGLISALQGILSESDHGGADAPHPEQPVVRDLDWALTVLQNCGIETADQFDALVALQKLTP